MTPLTPAQQALVTENLDWAFDTIRWRARRKYPTFHLDPDELRSMASLALVTSVRRYDRAAGASFRTFAARRVMGVLDDSLRRNGYANSTAAPIEARQGSAPFHVEQIEARASSAALLAARRELPPLSRAVVGMIFDQGCDIEFAAARLGASVKQMRDLQRQALYLLTAKIKRQKKSRGGFRMGAGRPRSTDRCPCGLMTKTWARWRWHKC